MSDGFDFLGFRIQWKRKGGTTKWHVYTFIADRPIRSLKAKVRTLTGRTSQQELATVLKRLTQIMRGWANYFKHAVAKHVFDRLDAFVWWRFIRMLRERTDGVGATSAAGSPPRPGGGDPSRLTGSSNSGSHRSRSAATDTGPVRSPAHGSLRTPSDGRDRGEPVALRGARRVRREARRNGPGAIPTPRSGPTQRSGHSE
ncbi:group II intron maturase-specific domain-containing protein [Streptomyces sp. S465]|uniref:group II intron maturase-specific domain-containing protein n=1 Tax=Streptomyces sp. S465 TaxID=2979468 RepID=UPI0022A86E2E|nr:group II intron maturase-specific domain-containing protein [Streptomyces sp. S465]WAP61019.1 hypothetical protein N6H00_31745 [Streptomyces sp. S465]